MKWIFFLSLCVFVSCSNCEDCNGDCTEFTYRTDYVNRLDASVQVLVYGESVVSCHSSINLEAYDSSNCHQGRSCWPHGPIAEPLPALQTDSIIILIDSSYKYTALGVYHLSEDSAGIAHANRPYYPCFVENWLFHDQDHVHIYRFIIDEGIFAYCDTIS